MRQLVVVAVSPDGTRLRLAPAVGSRPSHEIALDERLLRAVRGQPLDEETPAHVSALTPKEIQARLRQGASVEDVAKEAGVPRSRVERYAGPVLSERESVLDAIRAATLIRPRVGRSASPLGESVLANMATTAFARPETAAWTAYRRLDGAWVARLELVVRGRRRRAEWLHDAGTGTATALDPYAAALGFVASSAPAKVTASGREAHEPNAASAKGAPAKAASAKGGPAKRASAKAASAKGAPAKGAPAKAASAKGASAKGGTAASRTRASQAPPVGRSARPPGARRRQGSP